MNLIITLFFHVYYKISIFYYYLGVFLFLLLDFSIFLLSDLRALYAWVFRFNFTQQIKIIQYKYYIVLICFISPLSITDNHSDEEIRKIYNFKNLAVVGMSRNPGKAAHYVPKYMIEKGYNIIPVNPTASNILNRRTYSRVSDIQSQVDIIDVFRPSEDVYPVIEDSIRKPGIRVIWLQEGIHNIEAEKIALDNNIDIVFNRCIMAEHIRLFEHNE